MCVSVLNSLAASIGATVSQGHTPKLFVIRIGQHEEYGTEQFIRGLIVGYRTAQEASNV